MEVLYEDIVKVGIKTSSISVYCITIAISKSADTYFLDSLKLGVSSISVSMELNYNILTFIEANTTVVYIRKKSTEAIKLNKKFFDDYQDYMSREDYINIKAINWLEVFYPGAIVTINADSLVFAASNKFFISSVHQTTEKQEVYGFPGITGVQHITGKTQILCEGFLIDDPSGIFRVDVHDFEEWKLIEK